MSLVHLRINTRSGCWVVLAIPGHSLVELSSTLGGPVKKLSSPPFHGSVGFFWFFLLVINVQCLRYYNEIIS